MSTPHEHETDDVHLDPHVEQDVLDLLDEGLGHPKARPEFRSELKDAFLKAAARPEGTPKKRTSTRGTTGGSASPRRTHGRSSPRSTRLRSTPGEPTPRVWFAQPAVLGSLVAAAAAVLLILRFTGVDGVPGGDGVPGPAPLIAVDGSTAVAFMTGTETHELDVSRDDATWIDAIETAARNQLPIETAEGSLRVAFEDVLALELAPHTRISFVEMPSRASGPGAGGAGTIRIEVERGTLRAVTLDEFPGTELLVSSPSAEVRAVGTQFAVDVFEPGNPHGAPPGTCVCCIEGEVEVRSKTPKITEDAERSIDDGAMGYAYLDGVISPPMGIIEDHATPLATLAADVGR